MGADDIVIAMVIAIVIIAIIAYLRYRLRGSDVEGYWGTSDGKSYRIRVFPKGEVTIEGSSLQARGRIRPLRSICVGDGGKTSCGSVDLEGRWLSWRNGPVWTKQGLLHNRGS